MISRTTYQDGPAVELTTDSFRLVAPLSFGPRIMHFGSPKGNNLFIEFKNEEGMGPGKSFKLRGGHRLWHAPEHAVRTYQPDNDPVEIDIRSSEGNFTLLQNTEKATGLLKKIEVSAAGPRAARITHQLTNKGLWPISCAPWALTMFRGGGRGVIPLLPKGEHPRDLLPEYSLVPWPYTDFSSHGWSFNPSHIGLNTAAVKSPQKLGITGYPGWMAYWIDGDVFVKAAAYTPDGTYPDGGSKAEVFSNGEMIELETLGELVSLKPDASCRHEEYWGLLSGLPEPVDEQTVANEWIPAIDQWRKELPDGSKPQG